MSTSSAPTTPRSRRRHRLAATTAAVAAAAGLAVGPGTAAAAPARGDAYGEHHLAVDLMVTMNDAVGSGGCDDSWGCGANHNDVMATTSG